MERQTKKQHEFIISLAGPNIDLALVNIEEMQAYCQARNQMALVTTEKKSYGELDRMQFQFVPNQKKIKAMAINSRNKPYIDVFTYLLENFKSGLIIIETDTLSEAISDMICKSSKLEESFIDIMLCKEGFDSLSKDEIARTDYFRIHANPEFDPISFNAILGEIFQEKSFAIMIAQAFVNEQYAETQNYFKKYNNSYKEKGLSDFVDYYQLNKQLSYFIYYDLKGNKILNVSREKIDTFVRKLKDAGMMPIPDDELSAIIEIITISE